VKYTPATVSGYFITVAKALILVQLLIFAYYLSSVNGQTLSTVMPPKRKSLGRSTHGARKKRAVLASETDGQREERLQANRERMAQARSNETEEQRQSRLEINRVRTSQARSSQASSSSTNERR
jgi:hypothetical protein